LDLQPDKDDCRSVSTISADSDVQELTRMKISSWLRWSSSSKERSRLILLLVTTYLNSGIQSLSRRLQPRGRNSHQQRLWSPSNMCSTSPAGCFTPLCAKISADLLMDMHQRKCIPRKILPQLSSALLLYVLYPGLDWAVPEPFPSFVGRAPRSAAQVRTRNRLWVWHFVLGCIYRFCCAVAYGWSSDIIGFIVEKVSGQTLEQFWYVSSVLVHHLVICSKPFLFK